MQPPLQALTKATWRFPLGSTTESIPALMRIQKESGPPNNCAAQNRYRYRNRNREPFITTSGDMT
jgi:hypothetical protein